MNDYHRIQQAVEYIETHLQEDLNMERIAAQSCFSAYHFQRLFHAVSGFSVWEYIRKRRLAEAAALLKRSDRNILEIAVAYQYNSQEAFTRAFENCFAVTPAQYRKAERSLPKLAKINFGAAHPKINGALRLKRPHIITVPPAKITGFSYRANLENEQYYREIPAFWFEFYRQGRQKRIPNRLAPDTALGLAFDTVQRDALPYLIGAQVTHFAAELESGFENHPLPGGKYGEFTLNGPIRDIENAFRYIYGIWLPNSKYERGDGPDIKLVQVDRSTSTRFAMRIRVPLQ